MTKLIEAEGLKKSYGTIHAVRGIDLSVEKGTLFAFLGPNGAGKSTTIEILSAQTAPDAGTVRIGGHILGRDDMAIRAEIGIVFQDSVLDKLLTVRENLMLRGSFYGMKRSALENAAKAAAEAADVTDFLDRPYGKLSGGQRRRADIARALIHTPPLLFLDEPTTGLDPQTRRRVWETVRLLQKERGMTVFLTTHYMEEAAQADYIVIMDHGRILAGGTPAELKETYTRDILRIAPQKEEALAALLKRCGVRFQKTGGEFVVRLKHTTDAIRILESCREEIAGFEVRRGTMDDVFLNITGTEVRD